MLFDFAPTDSQNFTFSPTLDSVTYSAEVKWNLFGQRWYIELYDLNGTLIVSKAIVASPSPIQIGNLTWDMGVVTATIPSQNVVASGRVAKVLLQGNSPSAYNGWYYARIESNTVFSYNLASDPGQIVTFGTYALPVDLLNGYFTTALIYWGDRQQFETV